jgi:hypothetical protein
MFLIDGVKSFLHMALYSPIYVKTMNFRGAMTPLKLLQ